MALDVAALLTPLSEDAPAGENLEYDAEFIELGTAAQRKPDQQYGDVKVPGEEPDWEDVQRRAIGVLERTRDLRPAMYLAQALARNEGYPGFRDALQSAPDAAHIHQLFLDWSSDAANESSASA